jgi:thiamine kinase
VQPTVRAIPAYPAPVGPLDDADKPVAIVTDGTCPDRVRAQVVRGMGASASGDDWTAMSGGKANRVWRIRIPSGDAIVKLYEPRAASRLFPNNPRAEARILRGLAGTGLAPEVLYHARTGDGPVLVYRAVPGRTLAEGGWHGWVKDLAVCLARVHRRRALQGYRRASVAPGALRRGIAADLAIAPESDATRWVIRQARRPIMALPPSSRFPALLHGDPVPGNVVWSAGEGVTLIDWQCPAIGDPVHDIALALSPGMRKLYGCQPLSREERSGFWQAYADPATEARHAVLLPLLSARIAAHCLAQSARGRRDYGKAALAEITGLEE